MPIPRGGYTMFHATSVESARAIIANGFQQSSNGTLGQGVYCSRDVAKAEGYGELIFKLRVHVGRVKCIDRDGPLRTTWNSHGYNSAWIPPNCGLLGSGREEDCVFNPRRVEIIGIAQAPDAAIKAELETLLANTPQKKWIPQRK